MVSNRPDALGNAVRFESTLGFVFNDKSLLDRALTHRSYINETSRAVADNERLEFLGDAVIDLLTAEMLYQRFPEQREGALTSMRAELVRRPKLAMFARDIDLGQHLYMGKGEEEGGGRDRDGVLCSAFEAVCGAIYLDQGYDGAREFLVRFMKPAIEELHPARPHKDFKSHLQEWAQAEYGETPHYHTVRSEGPDHEKWFTLEVRIRGRVFGAGLGKSKQEAAQAAARDALCTLGVIDCAEASGEAQVAG